MLLGSKYSAHILSDIIKLILTALVCSDSDRSDMSSNSRDHVGGTVHSRNAAYSQHAHHNHQNNNNTAVAARLTQGCQATTIKKRSGLPQTCSKIASNSATTIMQCEPATSLITSNLTHGHTLSERQQQTLAHPSAHNPGPFASTSNTYSKRNSQSLDRTLDSAPGLPGDGDTAMSNPVLCAANSSYESPSPLNQAEHTSCDARTALVQASTPITSRKRRFFDTDAKFLSLDEIYARCSAVDTLLKLHQAPQLTTTKEHVTTLHTGVPEPKRKAKRSAAVLEGRDTGNADTQNSSVKCTQLLQSSASVRPMKKQAQRRQRNAVAPASHETAKAGEKVRKVGARPIGRPRKHPVVSEMVPEARVLENGRDGEQLDNAARADLEQFLTGPLGSALLANAQAERHRQNQLHTLIQLKAALDWQNSIQQQKSLEQYAGNGELNEAFLLRQLQSLHAHSNVPAANTGMPNTYQPTLPQYGPDAILAMLAGNVRNTRDGLPWPNMSGYQVARDLHHPTLYPNEPRKL